MHKVMNHNWQIGRMMKYPYKGKRPEKQFAAVFDTNKCIACQTCTLACKTTWTQGRGQEYMFWNNVETKPYGGYPLAWDMRLLEMIGGGKWEKGVYTGKTIFEKAIEERKDVEGFLPDLEDWAHPNIGEDEVTGEKMPQGLHVKGTPHPMWFFYLPRICNHCTYPACLASCPRKAIYKRPEDGIVLVDQSRCNGYKHCIAACPYKKPMFNSTTTRSEKCVACYPKVEEGLQAQCMEQCIGKIRMQGWISSQDNAREDNPMDYLVHIAKVAKPLYPQFGTEPNVYYIPPIHVPGKYLKQMFGPEIEEAVEVYKDRCLNDPVMQGLLVLFGSSPEIMTKFEVKEGVALGYNIKGKLVAKAPILEPNVIREAYDKKLDVYRMDIT